MMKRALKITIIVVAALLAVAALLTGPIDREPIDEKPFYQKMLKRLDTAKINEHPPTSAFQAGWSRANLMPDFTTPMAGYAPRSAFDSVHDSLFVYAFVVGNGAATAALVSLDLLIAPPELYEKLEALRAGELPEIDFLYLSASHTHSGIGGWDSSPAGQLMTGRYDEQILDRLLQQTLAALKSAVAAMRPGAISYYQANAGTYVKNRLDKNAPEDAMLRGFEFAGADGSKAILTTFSAHATNLPSSSRAISADYPGRMINRLQRQGYDFAMFMSGAVGSHRLDNVPAKSTLSIEKAGDKLAKIAVDAPRITLEDTLEIAYAAIPLEFGDAQLRIGKNLKLRDWAFRLFFRPLTGELKYLELADIVFIGLPCDFSGEVAVRHNLYNLAREKGKRLIITSFNGDYVGYVIADVHYDHSSKEEARAMNWVGPGYGEYFATIIEKMIAKTD